MTLFEKISKHYTDAYGFFTAKHVSESDPDNAIWDTENNHLWTGQLNICLRYLGMFGKSDCLVANMQYSRFKNTLRSTLIEHGLHTRHAPKDIWMNSNQWDEISLDEHQGMFMSALALHYNIPIHEIYNYGRKTGFAYIEKRPFSKAFPRLTDLRGWYKLFKGIVHLISYGLKNKDYKGSQAMDKIIFQYPELQNLSRKRLPKDVYFMKRCAGITPNIIEFLHFFITSFHTLKFERELKISGKNRLVYALLALKIKGFNIFEKHLNKIAHEKLKEMYGHKYIYEIHRRYLWNNDNPLFELVKRFDLTKEPE
jgi:hypothetical protein